MTIPVRYPSPYDPTLWPTRYGPAGGTAPTRYPAVSTPPAVPIRLPLVYTWDTTQVTFDSDLASLPWFDEGP